MNQAQKVFWSAFNTKIEGILSKYLFYTVFYHLGSMAFFTPFWVKKLWDPSWTLLGHVLGCKKYTLHRSKSIFKKLKILHITEKTGTDWCWLALPRLSVTITPTLFHRADYAAQLLAMKCITFSSARSSSRAGKYGRPRLALMPGIAHALYRWCSAMIQTSSRGLALLSETSSLP